MRVSSVAFSILAGIAAACGVGLFGADWGPMAKVGIGFACFAGSLLYALDWLDVASGREAYRMQEYAKARKIDAETELLLRQPAAPLAAEPVAGDEPVNTTQRQAEQRRSHWDTFWQWLMQAGDAYGFTNSVLTTDGASTRVMSDDAWKKVMPYAVYSGVLVGGKPGKATKWAPDYSLERFEAEELWKVLPHPTFDPPEIVPGPYHATPRRAATPRTTPEKRVIDGVRAD